VTKYLSKTTSRRKGLFWLTASEISVNGPLAPLFLGPGEVDLGSEPRGEQSYSPHGSQEAERGTGNGQGQDVLFTDMAPLPPSPFSCEVISGTPINDIRSL
jgi:hypothetical protein